ncbi:serine protease easter, partial [Brachionus plicatilis]
SSQSQTLTLTFDDSDFKWKLENHFHAFFALPLLECGVTYFEHNANEHSSISVPYSWPAAGILEFMYTAFIRIEYRNMLRTRFDHCGTILINRKTALTAAHCIKKNFQVYIWFYRKEYTVNVTFNNFHPNLQSIYSAYFGTHRFVTFSNDFPHVQMGAIHDIYIVRHPDYDEKTFQNDIAVIKFIDEIKLDRYIQVACLPEKTNPEKSLLSKLFGYVAGFSSAGSSFNSWVQQNIKLDLYNSSMCESVQPEKEKNWNVQICAGEYNLHGNTTGQCHGDYGSALLISDKVNGKQKYVASGILSYDVPCSFEHSPAVYTKIEPYLDWINKLSKY